MSANPSSASVAKLAIPPALRGHSIDPTFQNLVWMLSLLTEANPTLAVRAMEDFAAQVLRRLATDATYDRTNVGAR